MKKLFVICLVIAALTLGLLVAVNAYEPCCLNGNQSEIKLLNGSMLSVTFEVKVPGVYEFVYVIKTLSGIPIRQGREIVVYDCTYGITTVYIPIGVPVKPDVNYLVTVKETITVSPQEDELYFSP